MKYAIIDEARTIINTIEVEPDLANDFGAHYLGESSLGVGDTYPEKDLTPPSEPTDSDRLRADIDFLAAMMGVSL